MRIVNLELHRFRNYENLHLNDLGNLVVFCGPNAVGKTNVLEAIHLITTTTSFRHPQINQLILQGCDNARIQADLADGNRSLTTSLFMEEGKKRFTINEKVKSSTEVKGILPAVSFIPDDLEIAKKSASMRRDTLDNLGVQLSKSYDVVYWDYQKALRYKNRLLKEESPQPLIDAINETLIPVAAQLYCFRRALFERIIPLVKANYDSISMTEENFDASYLPSWQRVQLRFDSSLNLEPVNPSLKKDQVSNLIYDGLQVFGPKEAQSARSLIGPHNDQITFYLGNKDSSTYASQGQQRSIVLAWKLAEVQLVQQMMGTDPVLLLDDVMSELDESRRSLLIDTVGSSVQTFITATDLTAFPESLKEKAQVIQL